MKTELDNKAGHITIDYFDKSSKVFIFLLNTFKKENNNSAILVLPSHVSQVIDDISNYLAHNTCDVKFKFNDNNIIVLFNSILNVKPKTMDMYIISEVDVNITELCVNNNFTLSEYIDNAEKNNINIHLIFYKK